MIRLEDINIFSPSIGYFEQHGFIISNVVHNVGYFLDSHWHDYYELEICFEGAYDYNFNGTKLTTAPGYAFLLSNNDIHSLHCIEASKLLNIRFNEELLPKEITEHIEKNNISRAFFEENELNYIKLRLEQVADIDESDPFFNYIMQNLIFDITIMFIRKNIDQGPVTSSSSVQRATSYILRNFRSDISLASVANEFNITPNYLGSILKKSTNKTFHEYLNNLRLKYACTLLVSTNLSVKEIAFQSGYNSVEHFILTFKKFQKITPTSYRKIYSTDKNNK